MQQPLFFFSLLSYDLKLYFAFAFITFSCTGILMYRQLLQIYEIYLHIQIHASTPAQAPFVPKIHWKSIYGECTVCNRGYRVYFSKWAALQFVESLHHKGVKKNSLPYGPYNSKGIFNSHEILCKIINRNLCTLWDWCKLRVVSDSWTSWKGGILNIFMVSITHLPNAALLQS